MSGEVIDVEGVQYNPNPNDVFLGRGGEANRLRDGRKFRELIVEASRGYKDLASPAKRKYAEKRVVLPIQEAGGRFFCKDDDNGSGWKQVTDIANIGTKVMQCLRDILRETSTPVKKSENSKTKNKKAENTATTKKKRAYKKRKSLPIAAASDDAVAASTTSSSPRKKKPAASLPFTISIPPLLLDNNVGASTITRRTTNNGVSAAASSSAATSTTVSGGGGGGGGASTCIAAPAQTTNGNQKHQGCCRFNNLSPVAATAASEDKNEKPLDLNAGDDEVASTLLPHASEELLLVDRNIFDQGNDPPAAAPETSNHTNHKENVPPCDDPRIITPRNSAFIIPIPDPVATIREEEQGASSAAYFGGNNLEPPIEEEHCMDRVESMVRMVIDNAISNRADDDDDDDDEDHAITIPVTSAADNAAHLQRLENKVAYLERLESKVANLESLVKELLQRENDRNFTSSSPSDEYFEV